MMRSPMLVFCLTYLFLRTMVTSAQMTDLQLPSSLCQGSGFVSVNVGDSVTLQCLYEGNIAARFYWYKYTLGQKPRHISTFYKYNVNHTFHDEFKNNPRFMLDTDNGKNHLTITDVNISDSATYYCFYTYSYTVEFVETTVVSVKNADLYIPALVHRSESKTIQPGGSVTLNCIVQPGTCGGKHRVYWFRNSKETQPGIIYTQGDISDQCERKNETQTHSCVYKLPLKNLNLSHAGTYYCAVAACGHILFGNGTKLKSKDGVNSPVLVYILSGALTFTSILVVLLAFLLYKKNGSEFTESQPKRPAPSTRNSEGDHGDNVHYAALSANLPNRSRRQKDNTMSQCVYTSVKV